VLQQQQRAPPVNRVRRIRINLEDCLLDTLPGCTCTREHSARDERRPNASSRAKEDAGEPCCPDGAERVSDTAGRADAELGEIVHQRETATVVAEGGTAPSDGVEDSVQPQSERGIVDANGAEQALTHADETTKCKAGEVDGSGTVGESIAKAAIGNNIALYTARVVVEVEIFDLALADAGEGVDVVRVEGWGGEQLGRSGCV